MNNGIIFIAGVYGVGKSTLCAKLKDNLKIPYFSASDLISEVNGEQYGKNKVVNDKNANQNILINAVKHELLLTPTILLAGHFCIFNSINEVELLPEFVYKEMPLSKIILLEAETNRIIENIQNRDNKAYSKESLNELIEKERTQAIKISSDLNITLTIHHMQFDKTDIDELITDLQGSDT